MVIVVIVCMLAVIAASVWVVIVEIYVYVLFRKLFSVSNECRLINYHLPFKTRNKRITETPNKWGRFLT